MSPDMKLVLARMRAGECLYRDDQGAYFREGANGAETYAISPQDGRRIRGLVSRGLIRLTRQDRYELTPSAGGEA